MKTPSSRPGKGQDKAAAPAGGNDRIAKVIARAGLCSRREAEAWIAEGRVSVNGTVLSTPAVTVGDGDTVLVDGAPLPKRERTRLWLFHKPKGTVTTTSDPEGRATVFSVLPPELPRVMTVGRLDINTEGLLLLTNDGGLARVLELPATGWLRRYRVRAHGEIDQPRLDALKDGVAIDGVLYGSVEATLDRKQGDNVWLTMGLREGKNREVKTILGHLGLEVNRLIRVSFGPFQLGELADGSVEEVPRRVLRAQLGDRLAIEAGADFTLTEDDRLPIQQKLARDAAGGPAPKVRPATASAGATRRRHEADLDGEQAPKAKRRTRATPAPVRAEPNAGRDRLALAGAAPAARKGRLARPADETETAGRAYRSGKAFEVDRKPQPDARKAGAAKAGAAKTGGDQPAAANTGRSRPAKTAAGKTEPAARAPSRRPGFDGPADGPRGNGGRPAGKPGGRNADRRR